MHRVIPVGTTVRTTEDRPNGAEVPKGSFGVVTGVRSIVSPGIYIVDVAGKEWYFVGTSLEEVEVHTFEDIVSGVSTGPVGTEKAPTDIVDTVPAPAAPAPPVGLTPGVMIHPGGPLMEDLGVCPATFHSHAVIHGVGVIEQYSAISVTDRDLDSIRIADARDVDDSPAPFVVSVMSARGTALTMYLTASELEAIAAWAAERKA